MSRYSIVRDGGLENAAAILTASERAGVDPAVGCALVEQESGGANIYGHDAGGIFSTAAGPVTVQGKVYPRGSDIPVTPTNAAIFLIKLGAGAKSNGMGLTQITYAGELPDGRSGGYFRLMLEEGLRPWAPIDNAFFGIRLLAQQRAIYGNWRDAAAHYNGGKVGNFTYADEFMTRYAKWLRALRGA